MKLLKLSSVVVALALSGCATGPDYQLPDQTLDTEYLYQQTAGTSQQAIPASTSTWWYQFNDTMLNQLVADAQQQNIPLKIAAERIKAAQAYQNVVESFKVPTVSLGAGYSSFGLSENDPLLGPVVSSNNPLGTALVDSSQGAFHAGATIAWEMDLFGRIDKQAQAAAIRKEQTDIFREGLTTMITSDVIHNYLQMRGAQTRRAIATEMVSDQEETLALIQKMLKSGYGSELDLARAKAMLAATKSVIPQLQTAENVHQQRLAILLGETPAAMKVRLSQGLPLPASQPMPELNGIIPTGLPSDLLQRRPDIRIAEREMAAVNAELGAAIANQYPKFYLTGAPGVLAKDFDDLFSSDSTTWIANIGVSWNLFDGGRNDALIEIQEARFKSSALSYQHTVNNAIGEVETLLNGYGNSQQYQTLLLESKAETDKAVKKAKSLYAAGLTDYLVVLDAQRQQHIIADRVIAAKLQTANVAVGLNKALGGDWELH
ncbi:efflux transporter outer membrane subunit [Photobacterium chitinilyticum]|uniref:Efflux transporter outer membrane subunit n=1 Tax=Photobacterium chitinilyticum TaxID=2485123 RepID=A0A3S3RI58_9GAMM|nr:efflux transporter outer membrane subunit [Photobacterium chitinilyticum]RWX55958.1 efflux transporter outer membrane subunit [Photobacterium chitinilyticum]